MAEFLHEQLDLELSQEKTLITHARTEAARFLGYEIVSLSEDTKRHRKRRQRCINGVTRLKVPVEVIKVKCDHYMRKGKPAHLAARLNDTDYSIVTQYQAEYRGVVQYYLMAYNVHRFDRLHWVMELSLARTLANKHKTSVRQIYRKHRNTVTAPHGNLKVLEATYRRDDGKPPLVARFGGIELRWQKRAVLNDQAKEIYNGVRSELVQRLLAQECELCDATGNCQVHHVRKLADLNRPGHKVKPVWVKRMIARRRKTLVVCQKCHEDIHAGRLS